MLLLFATAALAAPIEAAWVQAPPGEARAALAREPVNFAESTRGDDVLVHADPAALSALAERGWVVSPAELAPPLPADVSAYHSPEAMNDRLLTLAEDTRAERVLLGHSLEGRPIYGLRMGVPGGPAWRILGAHHGDEWSSAELALATAEALLDDAIPGLLDSAEIWVVPHVNPDGHAAASRYNARGVDLNRNYSHHWGEGSSLYGAAPFSEPESRAIRGLSLYVPFHAGISMHSGALNLGWPLNYTTEDTPDEARLEGWAERYADACALEDLWITNGADWYITYGDTNDWSYALRGTLDYTLEVSETKIPDSAALDTYLSGHLPAVLTWLETPVTLTGRVVDAETGLPVEATLSVGDATADFPSGPVTGTFARLLEPGDYSLSVSALGYETEWRFFQLEEGGATELEIALEPEGLLALRPEPALISKGMDAPSFSLPDLDADTLTLTRPGAEPISLERGALSWTLDPAEMAPGPWTILLDDGRAAPRALFIGADDDAVQIRSLQLAEDTLTLEGVGFAEGLQAYALQDLARAPRPLAVLARADDVVTLGLTGIDQDLETDLLLLSGGAEIAALDIFGDYAFDTDAPQVDTGWLETGSGVETLYLQPTCGCGAPRSAGALATLLPLLFIRRRTR